MKKNIIWAILLFFMQPTLILGLIYTGLDYKKRVEYSREKFRVNFIRNNFELRDFLLKGLLPGLIISAITLLIGIPLTIEWYIIYQILTVILILISGLRFIHPIFTFPLSLFALYLNKFLKLNINFNRLVNKLNQNIFITNFENINLPTVAINIIVLASLTLLLTTIFMKDKNENKNYPVLKSSKRGKAVAVYQNKLLWLMPLVVVVPGKVISPFASWWPMLSIGEENFAILILPILLGFHYTISTQFMEEATRQLKKEFQLLAILGLALSGGAYFYPKVSFVVAGILLLGGLIVLYRHRQREKTWTFKYGPVDEGLRIIGVRPNSPAERMNLVIGDVITDINNQKMNTKKDFNEVIAYNRSYVNMRVKRKDDEIIIVETPLYDDDYNNLGLLILNE